MTLPVCRRLVVVAACVSWSALARGQDPREISPDELPQHLVKILRTTNKAQTNRYVPKVYEFQHVNPYAVIRFARRVMEIEEGAWFSFVEPDMLGGKLLVVCPEYQIPGLDQLMAIIDRPRLTTFGGTGRICYRLRHRDAVDPGVVAVSAMEGTPTAKLIPDVQINGWFLEDAPSGVARIADALIHRYDVPTPQAEATVTVYEIAARDAGQLGLDYVSWKNGPGRNLFALGAFAEKEKISTLEGGASSLVYHSGKGTFGLPAREFESTGRNAAYLLDVPSAYFDFLAVRGQARVLTHGRLTALNGTTALLEVSDDILYYREQHVPDFRAGSRLAPLDPFGDLNQVFDTADPNELTDALGVTVIDHPDNRTVVPTTTQRVLGAASSGFFFQLTPTINGVGCFIDLLASFVDHVGYADDGTPVLTSRVVDTRFKIPHDGREITLGAQVRKRRIDSTNKMPWLGSIPVLGTLFGGESHTEVESLVVVTFKITKQEFPYGNETDADTLLKQVVDGQLNRPTATANPGFIHQ